MNDPKPIRNANQPLAWLVRWRWQEFPKLGWDEWTIWDHEPAHAERDNVEYQVIPLVALPEGFDAQKWNDAVQLACGETDEHDGWGEGPEFDAMSALLDWLDKP